MIKTVDQIFRPATRVAIAEELHKQELFPTEYDAIRFVEHEHTKAVERWNSKCETLADEDIKDCFDIFRLMLVGEMKTKSVNMKASHSL